MPDDPSTSDPYPTPLVSVAMTAYNSAQWLPRALESVLAQQTDFPVEIVIGDDCSKDNTLQVARTYLDRYPGRIRILERSANVGIQRNYYETFEACRGKYIAWLDADDIWTDPAKLALQVAALEADDTLTVCGHFVRWVNSAEVVQRPRYPKIAPGRYGLAQMLHHDFLPALAVVFRNGIHRSLPNWYFDLAPTTDWPIWVLAALAGDILLLDRNMADYRITPGSALISKGELYWYQTDARFYEHIESVLPPQWQRIARSEKGKRYEAIAYFLRKQGDFAGSREAAVKAFRAPALFDNLGSKTKGILAAAARELQSKLRRTPPAQSR